MLHGCGTSSLGCLCVVDVSLACDRLSVDNNADPMERRVLHRCGTSTETSRQRILHHLNRLAAFGCSP